MRILVVIVVALAACGHEFDYGDARFTCDAVARCGEGYTCAYGRCAPSCEEANGVCPADQAICDPDSGGCRQCQIDVDCGGTDRCSGRGDCVECTANQHCGSRICERELGSCVAGVVTMTRSTITTALPPLLLAATDTVWVLLLADALPYPPIVIDGPVRVVFVAAPGSTTTRVEIPGLEVGAGADVTVEGATISGGDKAAVQCVDAAVTLRSTRITSPERNAVHATDCTLRIERSQLEGNAGGIAAINGNFVVVSTVISGSSQGAVTFQQADGVFAFNTVVDNHNSVPDRAGGVTCQGGSVNAIGNLIHRNTGTLGSHAIAGSCRWSHSNIEGGADGPGNFDVAPTFDPGRSFHLMPGTAGIDAIDVGVPGMLLDDIDGEPRPRNGWFDVGADEQ